MKERIRMEQLVSKVRTEAQRLASELNNAGTALYEEALLGRLRDAGLEAQPVLAKEEPGYQAGIHVAECISIECRRDHQYSSRHLSDCINHLASEGLRMGMLINLQGSQADCRTVLYAL